MGNAVLIYFVYVSIPMFSKLGCMFLVLSVPVTHFSIPECSSAILKPFVFQVSHTYQISRVLHILKKRYF
jgi:hypothetical protein